jgi:hypothetical protein
MQIIDEAPPDLSARTMSENAQTSQSRTAILTPRCINSGCRMAKKRAAPSLRGEHYVVSENLLLSSLPSPDFQALRSYLKPIAREQGTILHDTGAPISGVYFPFDAVISLVVVLGKASRRQ